MTFAALRLLAVVGTVLVNAPCHLLRPFMLRLSRARQILFNAIEIINS